MPLPVDITIRDLGPAPAGASAPVDLLALITDGIPRRVVTLTLETTAVTGSLAVTVETSATGNAWRALGAFETITGPGFQRVSFGPTERMVRVAWTFTGTGASATFSVFGAAELVYVDLDDFYRFGLPRVRVEDAKPADAIVSQLLAVSSDAYGAIPRKWRELLRPPYPYELRRRLAQIAAAQVLIHNVGVNPDDAADGRVIEDGEKAQAWLDAIASGKIVPTWIEIPEEAETRLPTSFAFASDPPRGW